MKIRSFFMKIIIEILFRRNNIIKILLALYEYKPIKMPNANGRFIF